MNKPKDDSIARRIEAFDRRYSDVLEKGLYFYESPIQQGDGAWVVVGGKRMLHMASTSYLGLSGHPRITEAAVEALARFGSGSHARLLAGTLPLHKELERKIAEFKGTDDAITFSSGYVTNVGVISSLVGKGDVVICDKLDHASIVDGCRLSRAEFVRFDHNDMEDLAKVLRANAHRCARLVVIDAVFSMDGDIVNLPEVVRLCQEHNAWLMVDEAHSLGVLGESGKGILEHFGIDGGIDIHMGTLSKTIPSIGGYVAGSDHLVNYLRHAARPYIFSAGLPPSCCAAAIAALEVIESEPERRIVLKRNTALFHCALKKAGFNLLNTQTPIVPIITGTEESAWRMAAICQAEGLFVLPIVPPAVPPGLSRLRAIVTAKHTEDDIRFAVDVLTLAGRKMGLV